MCRALGRMMKENGASTASTARDLGMLGSHSGNRSDEGSIQSSGPEPTGRTEAEGQPATGNNGGGNDNWNDAARRSSGGWQGGWWTPSWSGYSWDRRDSTAATLEEQKEEDAVIRSSPMLFRAGFSWTSVAWTPWSGRLSKVTSSPTSRWQVWRTACAAIGQMNRSGAVTAKPGTRPSSRRRTTTSPSPITNPKTPSSKVGLIKKSRGTRMLVSKNNKHGSSCSKRQSEVKMSRRFYRPGNGKGNAKNRGPV